MRPGCPTLGSTTDGATHFSSQAPQRSGSFFRGYGLKAVPGRRRGAAARFFFFLWLPGWLPWITGCQGIPIPGKHGTHYLIIGVGLVHAPAHDAAVLVTRTQALGLSVNTDPAAKFALGYASGTVVSVPDSADDVRVEVSGRPGGMLNIHSQSSVLQTNQVPNP